MWGYIASLAGMATTGGMLYRYRQKVISMLEGTAIERKYLELRQKCINMAVDELMHHFERKEKASHVHVGANHIKLEFDHNGESYQLFLPKDRRLASRQRRMNISAVFDGEAMELNPYPGLTWCVNAKQIGAEEIWVSEPNDDITNVYMEDTQVSFGDDKTVPEYTLTKAIDTIMEFNGGDASFVISNRDLLENAMTAGISVPDLLKRKIELVEFSIEDDSSFDM